MIQSSRQFTTKQDPEPHVPVLEPRWHVAYVITRHEKAVAQELNRRSVESFLPTYHTVHYWNGRRAEVDLPLFPSYVFVHMILHERLCVLQVPGVVHLVSFNGLPASIPEVEMEALRAAISLRKAQPHPYYSLGDRVQIKAGPLKGLQGTLIRQQSSSRMIVAVDFIHRSVSVELEPSDLGGVL